MRLIKTQHTALGYRFPRGPVAVQAKPFKVERLSARLTKVYQKVAKRGEVPVRKLDRDARWAARQLVKVGALAVVKPELQAKAA